MTQPVRPWPAFRAPGEPLRPKPKRSPPAEDLRGDWGETRLPDPASSLLFEPVEVREAHMRAAALRAALDWPECVLLLQGMPPPFPCPRQVSFFEDVAPDLDRLREDIVSGAMPMPCSPARLVQWASSSRCQVARLPPAFTAHVGELLSTGLDPAGATVDERREPVRKPPGRPSCRERDLALFDMACRHMESGMSVAAAAVQLERSPKAHGLSRATIVRILMKQLQAQVARAVELPRHQGATGLAVRPRGRPSLKSRDFAIESALEKARAKEGTRSKSMRALTVELTSPAKRVSLTDEVTDEQSAQPDRRGQFDDLTPAAVDRAASASLIPCCLPSKPR